MKNKRKKNLIYIKKTLKKNLKKNNKISFKY